MISRRRTTKVRVTVLGGAVPHIAVGTLLTLILGDFWATVCRTVRPMLSVRCPVMPVQSCPVCNVGVLWPNSCMDQDETGHVGRPRPWPHCVRWGRSFSSPKGHTPIFGPYLLRPNGCMDQVATQHGAGPRPRRLCVRGEPSPPSPKGGGAPSLIFGQFLLWPNGWMHQDATWYRGRPRPKRHCVRWGSSPAKRDTAPNFWPMSIVARRLDWMDQNATWYGGRPRPRRHGRTHCRHLANTIEPSVYGGMCLTSNYFHHLLALDTHTYTVAQIA